MGLLTLLVASALASMPTITTVETEVNLIGEKLGRPVAVQASLGKKLLYISDSDVAADRLLALIATAVHGSVRVTPTGLLVERSTTDLAALREEEQKERADWIRTRLAAVADYRKRMSIDGGKSGEVTLREVHAKQKALQNFWSHGGPRPKSFFPAQLLPSEVLLEDLIRRIGIDKLAAIPAGQTVIYEDAPVENALTIPTSNDLVDKYVKASAPYEAVILSQDDRNAISLLNYGEYFSQFGQETKRPIKLRLRVKVTKVNQQLQLDGFDDSEKRVLRASFVTAGSMKSRVYTNVASEDKLNLDAKWAPISNQTQDAIDELKRLGSAGGMAPDWLLHPEKFEPLNAFVAGCLQALATQSPKKCTVVDVDDFFWNLSCVCCTGGRLCTSAFQDELDEIEDYERLEDPTSIVLRPRAPESIEATRADRKVLGRAIRELVAQSGERIRTLSLLCHDASTEPSPLVELFTSYATHIAPDNADQFLGDETYRVLGGISDDDWTQLKAGRHITVAQAGASEAFISLLISENRPVIGDRPVSDLRRHPMELFSNDSVGATPISAESRESTLIRWQHGSEPTSRWQPLGRLSSLAPQAVDLLANGQFVSVGTQDSFEQRLGKDRQFQTALQTLTVITIRLPQGQRIEIVGSSEIHDISSLGAYSDLSQAVRNKVLQDTIETQKRQLILLSSKPQGDQDPSVRKVPPP